MYTTVNNKINQLIGVTKPLNRNTMKTNLNLTELMQLKQLVVAKMEHLERTLNVLETDSDDYARLYNELLRYAEIVDKINKTI